MNSFNPNSKYKTIGEVAKILDLINKKRYNQFYLYAAWFFKKNFRSYF